MGIDTASREVDASSASRPPTSSPSPGLPSTLPRTARVVEEGIRVGLQRGAQVYVSRGGEQLDLAFGERADGQAMTPDTLNLWLSSTKPVTAVSLALLWQDGEVDLDDPVARYVPEFAQRGKGGVTLRHVLTHTGGIRMLSVGWPEASWDEIIATICGAKPEPRWPLGDKAGYHMASSWFLLGEVIARIAGEPFPAFVRRRVLEPLGMRDSWIGMPKERFDAYGDRIGRMWSTEAVVSGRAEGKSATPLARNWHTERHVVGCSPGGNGYGPIRELGLFYEMLLRRGVTADDKRLLTPQTVEALTTPQRVGIVDQTFRHKLDWGLGFIVDSKHYVDEADARGDSLIPYGYGHHASRRTFGHSGYQSSTAFADPKYDLVVCIFTNGNPGEPRHTERFRDLTEAVYEDLSLA